MSFSVCYWDPKIESHKCGYCKNENSSKSHGMWSESLTVEDYQNLIDRGWRRCGKYCYKPLMNETCCPQYTIRNSALNLKLSKSQKKVIKKFNKFINSGVVSNSFQENEGNEEPGMAIFMRTYPNFIEDLLKVNTHLNIPQTSPDVRSCNTSNKIDAPEKKSNGKTASASCMNCLKIDSSKPPCEKGLGIDTSKLPCKKGLGIDPSKPPCKKAKLFRKERKQQKLLEKGIILENQPITMEIKQLEDFLKDISKNSKHKLRIKFVSTSQPGSDWKRTERAEYEIYKKYQMVVHDDPPSKCSMHGFLRFLVHSPLKVELVSMSVCDESFKSSAAIYKKYQTVIHNEPDEECDEDEFNNCFVETPLKPVSFKDGSNLGYGSFHQQYWLDDKLIAVGVIDILPKCVSSVYFFYDPDYRNLVLGTYGSLRELEFTRFLNKKQPSIMYYYLGFYIHSCQKMQYKGKWLPSHLLCPETYKWFPIETCISKLIANKYARLNDNIDDCDELVCLKEDIDNITIITDNRLHKVRSWATTRSLREAFNLIGSLIGSVCARSMFFVQK